MTANVCVLMAGYLAEEKFQGHHWRWEEDVIEELRAVRSGHNEDVSLRGNPTDVRAIAQALFQDSLPTAPADARPLVTYCRQQTSALLDELRVWAALKSRLAQALLRATATCHRVSSSSCSTGVSHGAAQGNRSSPFDARCRPCGHALCSSRRMMRFTSCGCHPPPREY